MCLRMHRSVCTAAGPELCGRPRTAPQGKGQAYAQRHHSAADYPNAKKRLEAS